MHRCHHALNQLLKGLVVFLRTANDFIVNIGDIAHIRHIVTTVTQPARHHIKGHHDTSVTNMTKVIHGHTADIHAHMLAFQRLQWLFGFSQSVINRYSHALPHESRKVTVRLNTSASGLLSTLSKQK